MMNLSKRLILKNLYGASISSLLLPAPINPLFAQITPSNRNENLVSPADSRGSALINYQVRDRISIGD
jgi:hypothetical protein